MTSQTYTAYLPSRSSLNHHIEYVPFLGRQISVWLNSYKLPIITSDRDFLELILSIELPAHAEPFSESHEQAVLAALSSSTPSVTVDDPVTDAGAGATQKRSFLVISLPTSHTDAPERKGSYVRGMYASIEAVNESVSGGEDAVDWR